MWVWLADTKRTSRRSNMWLYLTGCRSRCLCQRINQHPPTHQYKCKSYNLPGLCGLWLIAANCLHKTTLRKVTGSLSSASLPRPKLQERGEHLNRMFSVVCWPKACLHLSFHQPQNDTKPQYVTRNWWWKQHNYEKLVKFGSKVKFGSWGGFSHVSK